MLFSQNARFPTYRSKLLLSELSIGIFTQSISSISPIIPFNDTPPFTIAWTAAVLGANPAHVAVGNLKGMRPLEKEESLARTLVKNLDHEQQIKAVFSDRAFRDILTAGDAQVSAPDLVGISAGELNESQLEMLVGLIAEYASVMPPEIASQRMSIIRRSSWDRIYFGWAGGLDAGQPHYYRIQGPDFLIEYDNVQNGANHIHTVWRDFDGDFGRDLLREHYDAAHQ